MQRVSYEATVEQVCETMRQSNIDFDAIAFRGMSGALIAPAVAARMHKGVLCIRKMDDTHAGECEGLLIDDLHYVILDDFISSGRTLGKIVKAVNRRAKLAQDNWDPLWRLPSEKMETLPTLVGIFLWNEVSRRNEFYDSLCRPVDVWHDTDRVERLAADVPSFGCAINPQIQGGACFRRRPYHT